MKNHSFLLVTALVVASFFSLSFSEELSSSTQTVTLRQAAELIVNSHPRIKQVDSSAKGEEEMIAVAKSAYYPQVSGGIGGRYCNPPIFNII